MLPVVKDKCDSKGRINLKSPLQNESLVRQNQSTPTPLSFLLAITTPFPKFDGVYFRLNVLFLFWETMVPSRNRSGFSNPEFAGFLIFRRFKGVRILFRNDNPVYSNGWEGRLAI